jgi:1,4-dihydroxy-2-naphthoate octaprenyltransferase
LIYPASNGYNSYFDKDEKSIGGLKNPPPVNRSLYFFSLALDVAAILLGYLKVNALFAVMIFVYGLASKAYSHPAIRLKRAPILGWMITGFFQGFFIFITCYIGLNNFALENVFRPHVLVPAMLSTVMLWGSYPMTQIYQHEEDEKRGDISLSLRLGIQGTFQFTALLFTLAVAGFAYFFATYFGRSYAIGFVIALLPVLLYFTWWFLSVRKDSSKANFSRTMGLNFISATALNTYFIYLFLDSTHVLDAFG